MSKRIKTLYDATPTKAGAKRAASSVNQSARRQRSPIHLEKDGFISDFLDRPVYKWVCDDARLRVAEFAERGNPQRTVIIHRSTKPEAGGSWQVSSFDERGAIGDTRYAKCTKALAEHVPNTIYRLTKVVTNDGAVNLTGALKRLRRR